MSRLDDDALHRLLSSPPFVAVEGVFNFRDFGGIRVPASSAHLVKQYYLYRSAELTYVTPMGKEQLRKLGIKTVFDLRADVEIARFNVSLVEIDGVEIVKAPFEHGESLEPTSFAFRLKTFEADAPVAFASMYTDILESGGRAIELVLTHMRDRPEDPFLIHCSAGKNRTGAVAAVILMLLGAKGDDIANDYALSEAGLQAALPMLLARLQKQAVFRENMTGTVNMSACKADTMYAVIQIVNEKYGGVEGYLKTYTSLREEDFSCIRSNMLITDRS